LAAFPADVITIHYHRPDGNYEGVNLWTWNGENHTPPPDNAIAPIGRDDFGAIFRIDRAQYDGSRRIGIIPRIGNNWSQKDGVDKFWTPALGDEIWLVKRKNIVFAQKPDISPQIEAAYLDAPDRVVVRFSEPAAAEPCVLIFDRENGPQPATIIAGDDAAGELDLTVTPAEALKFTPGRYHVQVEGFGAPVPISPRRILDDCDLFFDADAKMGASLSETSTTFRVFAPTATAVSLVLYDAAVGPEGRTLRVLQPQGKGIWATTVDGDLRGKFYTYLLSGPQLDSRREVLDPYATNTVASSTRGRITKLPAQATAAARIGSPVDAVIYEMHVRDFTVAASSGVEQRGLYLGWTEPGTYLPNEPQIRTALDHLSELGVTHVQILPVQDFENDESRRDYNWGYITSAFFSPEGLYASNPNDDSRVWEWKALVDALHARGLGVIMDVVYNHTSGRAPFFSIAPEYFYRYLPDGSLAAGSGVGNEFRSEAPMGRKYIIDSLKFWVTTYGIDGFRFDLMALLDQETMREAERELRAINPDIILFGEPWAGGDSPLNEGTGKAAIRAMEPIGAFNDDFRNALKGLPDGDEPGWIQNGSKADELKAALRLKSWFASPAQSINYMTCHDNLVLWDKLKASMPGASEALLEQVMKLGYLALFTAQGVPFVHGGEEFARNKGGNNNSYDAPDSVNEIDWSLKARHFALFRYVRDLIALRKAHPLFRLRTREEVDARLQLADLPNERIIIFTILGEGVLGETWKKACVLLNSDSVAVELPLPDGNWIQAFDSDGVMEPSEVSGYLSLSAKSGFMLYQM
jgi:pullulanase